MANSYLDRQVLPKIGARFKTKETLRPKGECEGFLVKEKYLLARKPNEFGVYTGYIPGCGGDVWWIEHSDESVGAYVADELDECAVQKLKD